MTFDYFTYLPLLVKVFSFKLNSILLPVNQTTAHVPIPLFSHLPLAERTTTLPLSCLKRSTAKILLNLKMILNYHEFPPARHKIDYDNQTIVLGHLSIQTFF